MIKNNVLFLVLIILGNTLLAQKPHNPSSSEILLKLKKLNFLGSVLYVAAHPDDENTRLISYLSNERLANTAYLSLTRGDGGQNLVGPEIREGLGIIRTQELLAARRIDGGKQFFSRANDFGYSKSTEETQKIWNRDQILEDVVWVYRNFRPDVIITRFPPDERAGHGHHTTSAVFAAEAMDLSADKSTYPEHLKMVNTWQPKRLYMNTGPWWNPDINETTPGVITINVGEYNELLGTSYNELASLARSQHKSQGFGATGNRGDQLEFLEFQKGEKASKDIFEGIDTTWGRVEGGKEIEKMINSIINNYNPSNPSASISSLLDAKEKILQIKDRYWKKVKTEAINEIVKGMLGLYLEAKADDFSASPGGKVSVNLEVINRTTVPVKIEKITYDHLADTLLNFELETNKPIEFDKDLIIPEQWEYSQPYWLKEKGTYGTYRVDDLTMRGKPENPAVMDVEFYVDILGHKVMYSTPLIYKWNDPVDGELYRPFVITPPVAINIPESVYIFNGSLSKSIEVLVKSNIDQLEGKVILDLPSTWKIAPAYYDLSLTKEGEEKLFKFEVTPPKKEESATLKGKVVVGNQSYSKSQQTITYDHIPTQLYLPDAEAKAVMMNIDKYGSTIGYIQGAGDEIPASLREIGYDVVELNEEEITSDKVAGFDAVVLGIRALNTNERADFYMPILLKYVENGGTLIIQYNSNFRLKTDEFAPYPLSLSRDRVSDELAEVKIIAPKHPVLNKPNKITEKDFENWVQERGLYFPNEWDELYTAILSSRDEGETDKKGGLLITPFGKGYYIYTGYSWFRQLPAGVPGAFKLFVNMVSLGNDPKSKTP